MYFCGVLTFVTFWISYFPFYFETFISCVCLAVHLWSSPSFSECRPHPHLFCPCFNHFCLPRVPCFATALGTLLFHIAPLNVESLLHKASRLVSLDTQGLCYRVCDPSLKPPPPTLCPPCFWEERCDTSSVQLVWKSRHATALTCRFSKLPNPKGPFCLYMAAKGLDFVFGCCSTWERDVMFKIVQPKSDFCRVCVKNKFVLCEGGRKCTWARRAIKLNSYRICLQFGSPLVS